MAVSDISVGQTLLASHLWQSLALAACLGLALILGRRLSGRIRYGLASGAFLASLILPLAAILPAPGVISFLLAQTSAPVILTPDEPLAAPPGPAAAPALAQAPDLLRVPDAPRPAGSASTSATASLNAAASAPGLVLPEIALPAPGGLILALWAGVALVLILRTLRDLVAVERLVARARPAVLPPALGARMNGVRVAVSPEAPGPMAAGLFRPAIILPASLALQSPGMLGLLEHEHAHIRRHDMLAALIQRLVLALLWWSPALYWISRRMDEEREIACDEAAVGRTGDACSLARSLTGEAERQSWARAPRLAVGAIGPRSLFGRRVRRLIDMGRAGAPSTSHAGRFALAGLVIAGVLAALASPRVLAQSQTQSQTLAQTRAQTQASGPADAAPPALATPVSPARPAEGASSSSASATDEPTRPSGLRPDLTGLMDDLAGLGDDLAAMTREETLRGLPDIGAIISLALAEAEREMQSASNWQALGEADIAAARAAIEEARAEIRNVLGPEIRAEIKAALATAREEIAAARADIAAAMPGFGADAMADIILLSVCEGLAASGLEPDGPSEGEHGSCTP
jgi:beta-lactamase regulating signal transducer with metallopeptidase domain